MDPVSLIGGGLMNSLAQYKKDLDNAKQSVQKAKDLSSCLDKFEVTVLMVGYEYSGL